MLFYNLIRKDKKDCGIHQITFSSLILPVITFWKSGERRKKENIIKQYRKLWQTFETMQSFRRNQCYKEMQCKNYWETLKKDEGKEDGWKTQSINVNMLVSI